MGLPKLRFKGYKGEWLEFKIGDIATVSTGLTPLRSNHSYYESGSIPWVKTMDLNNSFIKSTDEMVNEKAIRDTSLTLLPSNTLLVAMYGGFNQIGRTGITTFVGVTNQAISALRPKDDFFDVIFLQNYLNHKVGNWRNVAASSRKDPNLTKRDIENFKVYLPSKEEQIKVASFFYLIDQKIEKQQEKIEQLEQFKKGMLQKIFSQEIRFKDENKQNFPEWGTTPLSDLGSFIKNYSFSRSMEGEGDYQHIHYGDIHAKFSGIIFSQTELPSLSIDSDASYTLLENGDVIFADASEDTSDLGKSVVLLEVGKRRIIGGLHTHCFRPNSRLDSLFLHFFTQTDEYRKFISVNANGVSVFGLSKPALSSLDIPLPNIKEQVKVSRYLYMLSQKIELHKKKKSELEALKKGLLSQMLV